MQVCQVSPDQLKRDMKDANEKISWEEKMQQEEQKEEMINLFELQVTDTKNGAEGKTSLFTSNKIERQANAKLFFSIISFKSVSSANSYSTWRDILTFTHVNSLQIN